MAKIKYDNRKALAKSFCGKKDNSCGKYFEGDNMVDCAHFIAHCLAAGGIVIKNSDPNTAFCPQGLAVRNTVLVDGLRKLAGRYEKRQGDWPRRRDRWRRRLPRPLEALSRIHGVPFNLGEPTDAPKVYGHSTSRCATEWIPVGNIGFQRCFGSKMANERSWACGPLIL